MLLVVLLSSLFSALGACHPPSSQINHTRGDLLLLINFNYLACFLPAFLNLNYPMYLLPLGFLFLLLCSLLSLLLCGWLGARAVGPYPYGLPLLSLLLLLLFLVSHSIYTFCLPALPILAPALLLAVQLFIKTIRCFRQAKNHSFTELNQCNINKTNTS